MIESLSIAAGTASFGPEAQALDDLSKINYLFGSNGAGKTTLSRIIADETSFTSCKVRWKNGTRLESLVYNADFVERNFRQAQELKGVFTLGEQQQETLDRIAALKKEIDELTADIEKLNNALQTQDGSSGKNIELSLLELHLTKKCWEQKLKYDAKFQGAFKGVRDSKDKYKERVLYEYGSNQAQLLPQAELEKKAESIFGKAPAKEPLVPTVNADRLISHESKPILKKVVIGKEDVDIAAMIKRLGNSDWVRAGRAFYDENEKICPFCQQKTDDAFANSLNEYFDETFSKDTQEIDDLVANYASDADRIQKQLEDIIATSSRFLDIDKLKAEKNLLDARIGINKQRLSEKRKTAGQIVDLESLDNVIDEIKRLIDAANSKISERNRMVENLDAERKTLTSQVWRFILEELKFDLDDYRKRKEGLERAINSIREKIKNADERRREKRAELRELEKRTTSIQPTIDAINTILSSFGFQSFRMAKSQSGNYYKLIRQDGSDAKTTLSEGEKTFITFLYFYHLLKGSTSESGMTVDRVVVFDDPVSSLDSEVLFIVSSLIKGLFDEVRSGTGRTKQIFVMTHNVYFHKEITYNHKRYKNKKLEDETFWVVHKKDSHSRLEKHGTNPISTSYDLLWSEVRRNDRSTMTIQNTLRRILENYFKILGGIDLHALCEKFDGQERIICKSLVSWINDGSHFAHDDLYVAPDGAEVETYLKVFEEIFKRSDHYAHYKMMMGIMNEQEADEAA